jgi:hypothetical protein
MTWVHSERVIDPIRQTACTAVRSGEKEPGAADVPEQLTIVTGPNKQHGAIGNQS